MVVCILYVLMNNFAIEGYSKDVGVSFKTYSKSFLTKITKLNKTQCLF